MFSESSSAASGALQVSSISPPSPSTALDRILSSYVPTRETQSAFDSLDVLVCGKCRSVFHHVDEFKSHSATCKAGEGDNGKKMKEDEDVSDLSSESAVAMVIWCNTMRRSLVQSGVQFDDRGE
jgi:hypothetical protein